MEPVTPRTSAPRTGEPPLARPTAALLLSTVFASGAAVMIVEMTAVRAVQPFFGSTTYVWTNVIAVVLAALALGYALGGRLADRSPSPRLLFGLLGAGGVLVALGAVLVTPVSRHFLPGAPDLDGAVSALLWGSLGTALLIFAPPILLLGAVSPMAIRLLARRGVGRAAGSVFALSTVGSIAGTYLPTLVLVPHLGSRGSLLVAAGILLTASATGLFALGKGWGRGGAAIPLGLGVLAFVAAWAGLVTPNRGPPVLDGGAATVLEETESLYQYLTVREDAWPGGVDRVMTINEGVYTFHAFQVPPRILTGSRFYDSYAVIPFLLDLEEGDPLRLCVVGMACGVNASQWHHFFGSLFDLHVDGAELDPVVIDLGRRYFGLPGEEASWLRVHTLDGRSLLELASPDVRYDAIVLDAFANELYVPFHLATREFFALCARRLADGGILAMNVHAEGDEAPNLLAIENTMATAFTSVLRVPHYTGGGYLLLARGGNARIDLSLLDPEAVRRRYAAWSGFAAWVETSEWSDLLQLSEDVRMSAVRAGHAVTASPGKRVLTDDHAPLAWLTDRFLRASEVERRGGDDERSLALAALRTRQLRLLRVVGIGWAAVLVILTLLVRASPSHPAP